jgi:formylglycine-generating enzyme required for sulfatase activity
MTAHADPAPAIEGFRLVRALGRSMDATFLAHDYRLDRAVVLHMLPPAGRAREAFVESARALGRVSHSCLSQVHRIREHGPAACVVESFERGERLDSLATPLSPERVRALGSALVGALAALHEAGVAHGEVRAARVVVSSTGGPRLIGLRGARANATPAEFSADALALARLLAELADNPLRESLMRFVQDAKTASVEEIRGLLATRAPDAGLPQEEENPYRGLRPFEAAHAEVFFGRQREVAELVARLREEPWLLVAAPSGAGKSSLVRAGLIPAVAGGALGEAAAWDIATMVPGARPLASLAGALGGFLGVEVSSFESRLREDPSLAGRLARERTARGLVLLVDQLEEALSLSDGPERRAFFEALSGFATLSPGVRAVFTLRGDFLDRLSVLQDAGTLPRDLLRATFVLPPMREGALRMAIVGPAHARGFEMETPAMVDALVAEQEAVGGGDALPLLSFVLAELWAERDREKRVLPEAALSRLGGAGAALARHGDVVLATLSSEERKAARAVLLALVTGAGARVRRSREELVGSSPARAAPEVALEALVRGRLVVAGEMYEIAHEALVRTWPRLRAWLEEVSDERVIGRRITEAALEWQRAGRPAEGLWNAPQLSELEALRSLPSEALRFVGESRKALRWAALRRWALRIALPLGALLVVMSISVAYRWRERSQNRAFVEARLAEASLESQRAAVLDTEVAAAREAAFARFDARDAPAGEALWKEALAHASRQSEAFVAAGAKLGLALAHDPLDKVARARLADVTYAWLVAAERDHDSKVATDLQARLAAMDDDGTRIARLHAPAHLTVTANPSSASVMVHAVTVDSDGRRVQDGGRRIELGVPVELVPGSYILAASAPGRYPTQYPVLLSRAQEQRVEVPLPAATDVAPGFVFVPGGTSLVGAADVEAVRSGLSAEPEHPVFVDAFLIAEHEVTYREYIEFLATLPAAERAARMPARLSYASDGVPVLARLGGPIVRSGDPTCWPRRSLHPCQDWLRTPVVNLRWKDAQAYVAWLAAGAVPTARLCGEREWERAARGADGRLYSHGDVLHPGDANFSGTYHNNISEMKLDEVGSFPIDVSIFGVSDLTGNASEFIQERGRAIGGSFNSDTIFARAAARSSGRIEADLTGLRVCASAPAR